MEGNFLSYRTAKNDLDLNASMEMHFLIQFSLYDGNKYDENQILKLK